MIERVIGAFKDLGFDLDDREIADILWLSVQMRRSQSSPFPQLQQQTPASTPEITPTPPQSAINQNKKSQKSSSKTETSANVYPQSSQDSNQSSSGLPIKVPTAQALRNQLAISRSLKPLKRRVPSKNEFILDETATAERIAEEKLLLPVMRPAPERWLELALVIDEGASMMLWKQTIKEFKQLLERHGAFRDVRTWGLFISEDSKVWLRSKVGSVSRQKKLHNPRELIDPNGRRLFVIISDCVSPAWRNGTITKALAAWASTSPMTIIQVLPEWLWERSALGVADSILLRSLAPGVPNQQLIMTALDLLDESDVVKKLKVPVVALEPESLKNWAWMVAGAGDVQTKGFLLALDAEIFDTTDESTENTSVQISAKQRLQRFRLTASPMARKLAGLLAAAPVSLPVVRLIRQTMLPKSSQVHVAEVFLGGILKPLSPIDEGVDADKIQYDFMDGVRDLLLDAVPLTESTKILREVSEYVAQRVGLSVDEFTAMLVNPGLPVDDSSSVLVRPFAQITAKVLRRLGGRYAELAEEMEQQIENSLFTLQKPTIKTKSNHQIDLEFPQGQVDLVSPLYVERPPLEELCYEVIMKPGSLLRIKAPRQMGKTSLMARILHQASQANFLTVPLTFQLADSKVFKDLEKFLQWFCASVGKRLKVSNKLKDYWDDQFSSSKMNCTAYFEEYLLREINQPLVLGLDEVDCVFEYPEIAAEFFGLLRAWHEQAKSFYIWKKLRLVVVHSTEVYVPMNMNQSPFNVGVPIELPEFSSEQILDLARRHGLNWNSIEVNQLTDMVGGHPYLVRVALYRFACNDISFDDFLNTAHTESSVYCDHLRRHLWNLEQHPDLATAMNKVVSNTKAVTLNSIQCSKLYSMGLVQVQGTDVTPRCNLYRQYFRDHLRN